MPRFGAEQLVPNGESMTVCNTSSQLPKPVEVSVESDQATDSNRTNSTDETFESLFNHGNEAVQEEDGDVEVEDEDEEDEEGDVSANRPNDATGGGHANNSISNDRRKKKRNRRRVRKRNATSNAAAVNEVVHEGSHHRTNYVVEAGGNPFESHQGKYRSYIITTRSGEPKKQETA